MQQSLFIDLQTISPAALRRRSVVPDEQTGLWTSRSFHERSVNIQISAEKV